MIKHHQREEEWENRKGKEGQYMVMEESLTLRGGHSMYHTKYIEHVSQKCTFKTHIILLTNVIANKFKSKKRKEKKKRLNN